VERTRLSERVAQGAGRRLDELEQLVQTLPDPDDDRTRHLLEQVRAELRATRDDLEQLSSGLHPRPLIEGGLAVALDELRRHAGPRIRVRTPRHRFPATVETTIWYACAEAVANATKHAAAGSIDVTVEVDDGWVVATVDDDGAGGAMIRPGGGLAGLHDRLAAVGGTIDIELRADGGTRLRARVPAA
jgi:signal transduction histidine kinase